MKPIEPGCLAMVIGGKCVENLGVVVRVIRWCPKDEWVPEIHGPCLSGSWLCETTGRLLVTNRGWPPGPYRKLKRTTRLFVPRLLIRLDGDADTESDADSIPNSQPKEIPA